MMEDRHQGGETAATQLPDIQKSRDHRNIAIDRVGVRRVKFPIQVLDRGEGRQRTIGDFMLTVDLPCEFKGTHMSRFLEVLNESGHEISVQSIPSILHEMATRLNAEQAHLQVRFPFFMVKRAPVTGAKGMMEFECGFDAQGNGQFEVGLYVRVPVTTLCPCSKEISSEGAHNQRGWVTLRVVAKEHVWLEELIEMVESCGSCALFPVLKRPDEKWVTETAFQNPRFVEDLVREVALSLDADARITSYDIEVENEESIHAHNAYASLRRTK